MIRSFYAIALIFVSSSALSREIIHLCNVENKGVNFIQPEFEIRYETETSSALIFDPLIDHFVGQPVAGKISEDGPKKRVFTWRVPVVARSGQNTIMVYPWGFAVTNTRFVLTKSAAR